MALDTKDNRTKREQYESTRSALWMEKASFEPQWRDCADFVKPGRLRRYVTDRNRGDRRNLKILDSTATFAHRTLAAGMHSGLTSPSRPWFSLSTPDPELAKFRPVKQWLSDVTEILASFMVLSNLYTSLPTIYGDEGLFGTACMGVMDDERELFRCYPYPIGTYALGLSGRQQVDTFLREYTLSVRQMADEFGYDALSPTAQKLFDRGEYEQTTEICWFVAPNPEADPSKLLAKYKRWSSCWFEKGAETGRFLRESGYNEFPVMAPRWEAAAEDIYGTDSPGVTALGDIKGLQIMTRRKAQGVELMINPSVQVPTQLRGVGVNLLPGGVNFVDQLQQQQGIRPVREVNIPVGEIREDIADIRYMIQKAFYEPLFLMLAQADAMGANPQKTATEILERKEEKFLALGPVVERNKDELHEPLIDRVYGMADRAGKIPPAPPELDGVKLKVTYQSVMALAQKMAGVSSFRNFVADVLPLSQNFPEVAFKLDAFKIVERFADAYGVPPELLRSDDDARALFDQARQQQAQAQQADVAAKMAGAARDYSLARQAVPA